ncbi:hypothetical protein SAMN04488097_1663 [Epilithonimonas lactis]|nr:hypothetical protein SAMN04488097_1663 [Epilithonimonas lactis]
MGNLKNKMGNLKGNLNFSEMLEIWKLEEIQKCHRIKTNPIQYI